MKSIYAIILATGLFLSSAFAFEGIALQTIDSKIFRGGPLIVNDLKKGEQTEIFEGHACGLSFSPDGQRISFIDVKNKKVMTCKLDGSDLKEVTECGYGDLGVTYWLPDGNIYYNYHNKTVFKVSAEGGTPEEWYTSKKSVEHFGISNDGKRMAWTQPGGYKIILRDVDTGEERTTGRECQGTMSPDGKYYTRNKGGHKSFTIEKFEDMSVYKKYDVAEGGSANFHRWSHFSQDFVVYTKDSKQIGVVHNIETGEAQVLGKGVIWDYLDKMPVSTYKYSDIKMGVLIRPSLDNGLLNVYLPSGDNALSEVLTLNGARISSQSLKGPGWHAMPIPTANRSVLFVRVKNAQGTTVKRINVR